MKKLALALLMIASLGMYGCGKSVEVPPEEAGQGAPTGAPTTGNAVQKPGGMEEEKEMGKPAESQEPSEQPSETPSGQTEEGQPQ